jgi:hypothetical protein
MRSAFAARAPEGYQRSALRALPRAAAALLALLLSVLAGPRGGPDDRRAERLSGEAAQVAPICGPLAAVLAERTQLATTIADPVGAQRVLRVCIPDSVIAAIRPLRTSPVAARAP